MVVMLVESLLIFLFPEVLAQMFEGYLSFEHL
jgi:hypothetical protein